MNEATIKITGVERELLTGSDFFWLLWASNGASISEVFAKGSVADSPPLRHKKENWQMFIKMIKGMSWESLLSPDIQTKKKNETELIKLKYLRNSPQELPKKKNKCWKCRCNCWKCCKSKTILSNMSHEIRTPECNWIHKVVLKTDLTSKQKNI
jgi:hypothetical protein